MFFQSREADDPPGVSRQISGATGSAGAELNAKCTAPKKRVATSLCATRLELLLSEGQA
jgi:hypothetical protein